MSRSERVEAVLSARRQQAEALDLEIGRATAIRDALDALDAEASYLALRSGIQVVAAVSQVRDRIRQVQVDYAKELAAAGALRTRLTRTTLSVGAVGRGRQGKSRFLQTLTGLSSEQIPDSSGGFCTGVTSVIRPGPAVRATVSFKTADEVLALMAPYYARLGLGGAPTTLTAALTAEVARPEFPEGDSEAAEHFAALQGLVRSLRAHPDLAGDEPRSIDPRSVRDWVTQSDSAGRPRTEFRLVDRVDITAPFSADLAGVSVVDLPGMGDTNLSDLPRIIDAVRDEIDVLVLLRRPDATADDWSTPDFNLYDEVAKAYPDIPMAKRSFLVLNRTRPPRDDNGMQCERFAASERLRSWQLADTFIVDAAQDSEVREAFDKIVDHLLGSTGDIERGLVTARTQSLRGLARQLVDVVTSATDVFGAVVESAPTAAAKIVELTRQTHKQLAVALENLVAETREARQRPDNHLAQRITTVVDGARADKGIPDAEELDRQAKLRGGLGLAYGYLLNEARAHLAEHFTALEPAVSISVEEIKAQVVSILRADGRLSAITDSGADWLIALAEDLRLDVLPFGSPILRALRTLADARLSYRGFLQHRIRPLLDGLNSDHPFIRMEPEFDYTAEHIRSMVEAAYDSALRAVDAMLRTDIVSEPSSAVFALVEEFVDGALRSGNAEADWQAIYYQYKNRIWPEEWESLAEDQADLKRWKRTIREFEAAVSGTLEVDR